MGYALFTATVILVIILGIIVYDKIANRKQQQH